MSATTDAPPGSEEEGEEGATQDETLAESTGQSSMGPAGTTGRPDDADVEREAPDSTAPPTTAGRHRATGYNGCGTTRHWRPFHLLAGRRTAPGLRHSCVLYAQTQPIAAVADPDEVCPYHRPLPMRASRRVSRRDLASTVGGIGKPTQRRLTNTHNRPRRRRGWTRDPEGEELPRAQGA